jgi:integrase
MAATWVKVSDKPRDRGIYKNPETGTIRVLYQRVEVENGKRATAQKAKTFRRGAYTISDPVSGSSKRVTEVVAARDFKATADQGRKAGREHDVAAEEMTLGEYWSRWLGRPSDRTGKPRRPSTLARIEESYRVHIEPTFGNVPLRSITVSDVKDWHARLHCGPAAKNKSVRTLRSVLASAVAEGLRGANPAVGIKATDAVRAITADEVFTDEQIAKLREAVTDRYRLLIDLLAYGMRIGEVIGLRRQSVSLTGNLRIERSVTEVNGRLEEGEPKSENGYRTLPLAHLREQIQRHIGLYAQPEADGFVFTQKNGRPVGPNNWRRNVFYPALDAAELPRVTPHALRHRIACDLADQGYTDVQIADWLGDKPATVALVYRNVLVTNRERIGKHLADRWEARNARR